MNDRTDPILHQVTPVPGGLYADSSYETVLSEVRNTLGSVSAALPDADGERKAALEDFRRASPYADRDPAGRRRRAPGRAGPVHDRTPVHGRGRVSPTTEGALPRAENVRLFREGIARDLLDGCTPQERPVAVIVCGQTGAGKTAVTAMVKDALDRLGSAAWINMDFYNPYHPQYARWQAERPQEADALVRPDGDLWWEQAQDYALSRGYNILLESAAVSPAEFEDICLSASRTRPGRPAPRPTGSRRRSSPSRGRSASSAPATALCTNCGSWATGAWSTGRSTTPPWTACCAARPRSSGRAWEISAS